MQRIPFIDAHTAGEPTRIILDSSISLSGATMAERRRDFLENHDGLRRAIVCEPRGHDVLVGALLTAPVSPDSVAGVIFFNNVGYLGMCGHGTIGVAIALAHVGRIAVGRHQLDTPVGPVQFDLAADSRVTVENVASYRFRTSVPLQIDEHLVVHGDVAWGGNWFFICHDHGLAIVPENLAALDDLSRRMRRALGQQSITGADGAEIDHIELIGPPNPLEAADARNFVLCPGAAYDRSPCGTGTSAKLACLAADGRLAEGAVYRQQSLIGSVFEASYRRAANGQILPAITGSAFVNVEGELILDPRDPYCMGFDHAQ